MVDSGNEKLQIGEVVLANHDLHVTNNNDPSEVAEKKAKKRKSKSSDKSRKKPSVETPTEAKDDEKGEGSGTRMGENQQICDADQEEHVDGHFIDVEASLDLMGTMEQDLQKEVGNADLVMIDDQEKDLEKALMVVDNLLTELNQYTDDVENEGLIVDLVNATSEAIKNETEMGTKEKDGDEEAKSEKPKKKKRSKKGKTPAKEDALVASSSRNAGECVFVTTNIDTRLGVLSDKDDSVSTFRDKICKEHEQCFPSFGKITISALKVRCGGQLYHLVDSLILNIAFPSNDSFLFVDVVSVEEKGIMLTGEAAFSNPKLLERETNDLTIKEALVTQAADKKTRKRKHKTSDSAHANESRKKRSLGDESSDKGEVPTGTIGKDLEKGEKSAATVEQEKDLALVDDEKESHKDDVCLGAIVQDVNQSADVESDKDGVDATSASLPNPRGDKPVINILVLMAPVPNKKGRPKKDADEATTSVKAAKKGRAKKDKQENVEKVVKKSSKKSRKKQSSEVVEEEA
ncbi:uncharacterized protein LOC9330585 [Arabidopsis lyrata subsp. lyrata]|uniref:uncharacterized protein LOC9330585 n=1 Tax=Arabidopsis lyrata subsp. lyrata TaxID=81972 RepID=UPI000A29B2F2|nr:uncharacterized protein LOC9330585 [Arabidopsis lyrata subsp. lyrata]|eukprot:XP_020869866.1 uncharacterized protein LOC9330585 [Arabidopsis lyrata subsp. lyrata]